MSTTLKLVHVEPEFEQGPEPKQGPTPEPLRDPPLAMENASWLPATPGGAPLLIAVLCGVWILVGWTRLTLGDFWGDLAVASGAASGPVDGFARLLYALWQYGGPAALLVGHAVLTTAGLSIAAWAGYRASRDYTAAALAIGAAAAVAWPILNQVGSHWLTALAAALVAASFDRRRGPSWAVVPVLAVWALADESFVLGVAMVVAAAGAAGTQRTRAWLVAGASSLVALTAPGGMAAALRFLEQLSAAQPLALGQPGSALFFASAAALLVFAPRTPRPLAAAALVVAAATLADSRMLAAWSVVWAVAAAGPLAKLLAAWPRELEPNRVRTLTLLACLFVAIGWSPASGAWLKRQPRGASDLIAADVPLYLGEAIQRRRLEGVVVCPPAWGDYFTFVSGGAIRPLAAPRDRLRRLGAWNDQRQILAAHAQWSEMAAFHHVDYFCVDRREQRSLLRMLQRDHDAKLVYEDQQSAVARRSPRPESVHAVNAVGRQVNKSVHSSKHVNAAGRHGDGATNDRKTFIERHLSPNAPCESDASARRVLLEVADKPSNLDRNSATLVRSRTDAISRPWFAT